MSLIDPKVVHPLTGSGVKSRRKSSFHEAQPKPCPQSALLHQALGVQATPAAAFSFHSCKVGPLSSLDFSR